MIKRRKLGQLEVGALGLGCMSMTPIYGQPDPAEAAATIRRAIELGVDLIDTSDAYGANGANEELVGRAIKGLRERVVLATKFGNTRTADGKPSANGRPEYAQQACEASLKRLGTDHLDLYLLHWPQKGVGISHVVAGFEDLVAKKKIRSWGVSNFGVREMEELFRVPRGDRCATNQIPYSLDDRAIERGVLPWCRKRGMPIMAYSPLGGEGAKLLRHETLARIGAAHGCSAATVALAWAIRGGDVIAIPQSGSVAHVKENAVALSLTLTPQDLQALDAAFPPGGR